MKDISLCLLLNDDGQILMFRRANTKWDVYSGKFGLIGGHVKEGESFIDGLKRECKEESNLNLRNPIYIKSYKFDTDTIHLYYDKIPNSDGVILNNEHTEFKFFNPNELTDSSVIPTTKYMYNDYLKGGK